MQAAQNLFAGEQGVAYIPMPKGRGFTPRLVKGNMEGSELFCFRGNVRIISGTRR
ncbi:hypothetical protein IB211_00339c [Intestinimonas butyriciproducens]|uniref:Uncharacterized protein n=1 Tax=Intestinimonas butyriciproducens TaxID=1297617 RepID=A0A0S2W046_9FIRM|nr:hypothetical protein IB211_00339c [Intestinimonas butyriciproducens]